MKRRAFTCIVLVAVLALASLGFINHTTSAGILADTVDKSAVMSSYISESQAIFAPEEFITRFIKSNELKDEHSKKFETFSLDDMGEYMDGEYHQRSKSTDYAYSALQKFLDTWRNGLSDCNDSFQYPDYMSYVYYMTIPEYSEGQPYELDGTMEPFKLCIGLVEGMEEEASDLMEYLSRFDDIIVYRYSKFSDSELREYVRSVVYPTINAAGLETVSYGVNVLGGFAIGYDIYKDDYEKACSIIQALAEESGYPIILNAAERFTFE